MAEIKQRGRSGKVEPEARRLLVFTPDATYICNDLHMPRLERETHRQEISARFADKMLKATREVKRISRRNQSTEPEGRA